VLAEFRRDAAARTTVGAVLSARWPAYLGTDSPYDNTEAFDLGYVSDDGIKQQSVESLSNGLSASLSALAALGLRVVVVAPTPFLPFSGPDCLAARPADRCRILRRNVEALRDPALDAVRDVVSRFPNARLWDPIDGLCDREFCSASYNGIVVYRDVGHLTSAAARSLDARALPMFEWLMGR
jgi:hypothetical protein